MFELPIHPLQAKKIREKVFRPYFKPFQVFTGPKNMAQLLEGSGITIEEVKKHSHEIKPGLWCFNVARSYDEPVGTKIHGLVGIAGVGESVLGTKRAEQLDSNTRNS